jgi:thioredoxin-dependent peroxiredoxin
MAIVEGQTAPDFSLPGSDGRTHRLKDYAGRKLIVYFYPRDNTPGCTKEACAFGEMVTELQSLGVALVGISKDSLASHDKFIRQFGLPFILLSDPDTTMMQAYDAWGEKKNYGKVSLGCIRSTVLINTDGRVLKHWKPVKNAAEHPRQVLDFLKNL